MAFRQVVHDTLDDWEEQLQLKVENSGGIGNPGSDAFRADLLRMLHDHMCVSFREWLADEVLLFALIAFDRNELVELTKREQTSRFFALLHKYWYPSVIDWIYLLWRFSGPSHQFFADLLSLLPDPQRPEPEDLGVVLFEQMVESRMWREGSLPSVVSVLVRHPKEMTRVKDHASDIHLLSKRLSAESTGLVCRSLLVYRARERDNGCICGYEIDRPSCVCAERTSGNSHSNTHGIDLTGDLDKEYARALIKYMLEHYEEKWNEERQDEFIRTTCDYVFSEQIYTELFQNLRHGEKPRKWQRHPRQLTDFEKRNNILRTEDGDYDHGFAQHAGCVQPNCKQAAKEGCENTCCNTHCNKLATKSCQKHKVYLDYDPLAPQSRNLNRRNRRRRISR